MNQKTDDRFEAKGAKQKKPETPTQAQAWAEGMQARLNDVSVTDNPHTSHVRHVWWRNGWKQADEDARWLSQREETLRKQIEVFD